MLRHESLRTADLREIIHYAATRHDLALTRTDACQLVCLYAASPPCKWDHTSLHAWVKQRLMQLWPKHFNPPTDPPTDIARFLAYMEGNYAFDGYPEDYARAERAKIDAYQEFLRTGDNARYVATLDSLRLPHHPDVPQSD